MSRFKFFLVTVVIALIAFFMPAYLKAASLQARDNFNLGQAESISENLYVTSGNVNIAGDVNGDLITAGGNVIITGRISDDVLASGGTINIAGNVDGDVRVIGGNVNVSGNINGDLAVVGGALNVSSGASVGGDILGAVGNANIDGNVEKGVKLAGGEVSLNGNIGENIKLNSSNVVIGSNAVIEGDLNYSSQKQANVRDGATISGNINFNKIRAQEAMNISDILGAIYLVGLIALLVAVILSALIFKRGSNAVARKSLTSGGDFGKELARGFILLVVIPILIIFLFASVIGSVLGLILCLSFVILLMLAKVFEGIVFGAWLSKAWFKKETSEVTWKNAVIGVIVINILAFIPVVGWIIQFIFFLVALGAISVLIFRSGWRMEKGKASE